MSQVQASDVKKLRDQTGAGFMDCKNALVWAEGDFDKALRHLKEKGKDRAQKKGDRVAASGVVLVKQDATGVAMVEINCETDFVARNETFQAFAARVLDRVHEHHFSEIEALSAHVLPEGNTVEQARFELVMGIGENVCIRRCIFVPATEGLWSVAYQHGQRIGVAVVLEGADAAFAEEMAMHIAASNPLALDIQGIDPKLLEEERSVAEAKVALLGKPADVSASIVKGMVAKFVDAHTLGGQEFIMNGKRVSDVLRERQARVLSYVRYELGEGIEVVRENFADAVRAAQQQSANTN